MDQNLSQPLTLNKPYKHVCHTIRKVEGEELRMYLNLINKRKPGERQENNIFGCGFLNSPYKEENFIR
jgi:hypothetical protein